MYLFGRTASKSTSVACLALCLLTKCQSRVRPGPLKIDLLKNKQHSQSVIAPFCFSLISPFPHTSFSGSLNFYWIVSVFDFIFINSSLIQLEKTKNILRSFLRTSFWSVVLFHSLILYKFYSRNGYSSLLIPKSLQNPLYSQSFMVDRACNWFRRYELHFSLWDKNSLKKGIYFYTQTYWLFIFYRIKNDNLNFVEWTANRNCRM